MNLELFLTLLFTRLILASDAYTAAGYYNGSAAFDNRGVLYVYEGVGLKSMNTFSGAAWVIDANRSDVLYMSEEKKDSIALKLKGNGFEYDFTLKKDIYGSFQTYDGKVFFNELNSGSIFCIDADKKPLKLDRKGYVVEANDNKLFFTTQTSEGTSSLYSYDLKSGSEFLLSNNLSGEMTRFSANCDYIFDFALQNGELVPILLNLSSGQVVRKQLQLKHVDSEFFFYNKELMVMDPLTGRILERVSIE